MSGARSLDQSGTGSRRVTPCAEQLVTGRASLEMSPAPPLATVPMTPPPLLKNKQHSVYGTGLRILVYGQKPWN